MGIVARVFSLPNLTLAAAVQSLVAIRFYADSFPGIFNLDTRLDIAALVCLANYAFGALFWCFIYPRFFSPLRHLHGPRDFFSAVHRTLVVRDGSAGAMFLDIANQYPGQDILSLTCYDYHVLVTNARMLPDLLVHKAYDFVKPASISTFLRHVLGDGLVLVESDQHKFLRKNCLPAFSYRHIKDLYPMMWQKSVLMSQALEEALETGEGKDTGIVDLSNWTSKVTLDIIGVAGMGREFNTLRKAEDPILDIYGQLLEPSTDLLLYALSSILFGADLVMLLPWRMNDFFKKMTRGLSEIYMRLIQEKKNALANSKEEHFDILSLLIKSGNFDNTQLKDQLLTFLAAGHETTSASVSWACYLLAKHPEIQDKLREEIRQALPDDSEVNESTDLAGIFDQLPYLNGIMHETLRLYPTVPITLREAIRDCNIAGQLIPKGVVLVLSMWQMNRSPELWGPEAGEFRPERWITAGKPNSNGGAASNYEFLTFLHGPRSCIGQVFAKGEIRCLLASMSRSFSWELAMDEAKIIPRGVITIKPANGLFLKLKRLRANED